MKSHLRRTPAPTHRHIVRGIDGKFRLWTNISAAHLGALTDEHDTDYRVLTCIRVCDTHQEAHKLLKTITVEGEWKA